MKLKALITLLAIVFLAGCGSSSSSGVDSGTEVEQIVFDEATFGTTTFN